MNKYTYTDVTLDQLRESLLDDRRAEYGTAEMDIEAVLALVDLAKRGLKVTSERE